MTYFKSTLGFVVLTNDVTFYKNTKLQSKEKYVAKSFSKLNLYSNSFFGIKLFKLNQIISNLSPIKNFRITNHSSKWLALLGPGGGFFGVGTSELIVIGAVAWLVLGPKRLYQLAKDIGKISGEIKSVAEEAKLTFQQAVDLESVNSNSITKSNSSKNNTIKSSSNGNSYEKEKITNLDELVQKELSELEKK
jgi:Sec-independent protein translocase protein TatA